MSNKSRRKGLAYENDVAAKLRQAGFPEAKRHLEYQSQEAKGYDLDNTGALRIQCKRYKQYVPLSKIEEVKCSGTEIPILVTKANNKRDIAALYLDDFLNILQDLGVAHGRAGRISDESFDSMVRHQFDNSLSLHRHKIRQCLKCRRTFNSKGSHNRLCAECNAANSKLSRKAQEEHLYFSATGGERR